MKLHAVAALIALTIFGSTHANAAISQTWTDRRPIGQLILSSEGNWSTSNLNGWSNGGPTSLGLVGFQSNILSLAKTSAENIANARGQGVIIWDITGAASTPGSGGDQEYLGDPRFLDPVGAGLTRPGAITYVPPGNYLITNRGCATEMNAIADRVFATFQNKGMRVGVCIRAQQVRVTSAGLAVGNQAQYDTTADQLADLDAKLTYAYKRWGCRIFYVDSNVCARDVNNPVQTIAGPTTPAWVYTELYQRHPDCLICPEEIYDAPFADSKLGINDPACQYLKVTAPYQEIRSAVPPSGGWSKITPSSAQLSKVPGAFFLLATNGGALSPTEMFSQYGQQIGASVRQGSILMFESWFDSEEKPLCVKFHQRYHRREK